jgi:hypothetical protein
MQPTRNRILYVDDDKDSGTMLKVLLEMWNQEVVLERSSPLTSLKSPYCGRAYPRQFTVILFSPCPIIDSTPSGRVIDYLRIELSLLSSQFFRNHSDNLKSTAPNRRAKY